MTTAVSPTSIAAVPLPYGTHARRVLDPLRTAFAPANRLIAPALKAGLGAFISNPLSGYLMVLRTRGRRTGKLREAPVGYVVRDGSIYCCAGFGESTAWYRNLLADPAVEIVLPGRTLTGLAAPVTDPEEWVRAYRALIDSLGLVSRLVMGDLRRIDDETLRRRHAAIPLVRIRPTGLIPGDLDPGGRFWLVSLAAWLALPTVIAWRAKRPRARRGRPVTGP
jgi:deazaflavin-dependent oxidoreductase (nitroreductase family)